MEMRAQIQQILNQNLNTKAQSVKIVNNFEGRNCNTNYQQSRKDFTRYPTVPQNSKNTRICTNCGQRWSHNHCQICPAIGEKCNNCGITGHLAQKCRKPKNSQSQTSKPPQTNVNQVDTNTTNSDDEKSGNYITSYQHFYDQVHDSKYISHSDDYVAAISSDSPNQLDLSMQKLILETSSQIQ